MAWTNEQIVERILAIGAHEKYKELADAVRAVGYSGCNLPTDLEEFVSEVLGAHGHGL